MKNVLFLTVLFLFSSAHAQVIKKIFDGTQAYCSEPTNAKYFNHDKIVRTSIVKNELVLEVSVCVNGLWVKDNNLKLNKYTTFEGIQVTEKYYNFDLVVKATNTENYKIFHLVGLENTSSARVVLADLKTMGIGSIDISVQSTRHTKTSTGYDDIDFLSWGSTRLVF